MDLQMAQQIHADLFDAYTFFNEGVGPLDAEGAKAACARLSAYTLTDLLTAQGIVRASDASAPIKDGKRTYHVTLTDELLAGVFVLLSCKAQPLTGKQSPTMIFNGAGLFLIEIPAPAKQPKPKTKKKA